MRIIGIDPGYDRLGVAVLEQERGKKEVLLYSGCIETPRTLSFYDRLVSMGAQLDEVLHLWQPEALAIEELFMTNNQKTAMRVAEARGVVLYLGRKAGISIVVFTPQEIKMATTGYGKGDKAQVTAMVERLLSLPKKKRLDDEYDAIAVALTGLASIRNLR